MLRRIVIEVTELSHLHSCLLSVIRICLFVLDLLLRIETATYFDGAPDGNCYWIFGLLDVQLIYGMTAYSSAVRDTTEL